MHHEASLPSANSSSSTARGHLDGWLTATIGEPTAENVRLAASELVANALRHGGMSAADVLLLSADVSQERVRVEVRQPSSASGSAVVDEAARGADGGYGLAIVERITDRWGTEDGPPGRVWFEIDRR